jgi:hypothetical protein
MSGTVLETLTDLSLDTSDTVIYARDEFTLKYMDIEPKLIVQYLVINNSIESPVALNNTSNEEIILACSMGYKSTLMGQINSLTDRVISSYDPRFTNESKISIDGERMYVLEVSHDFPNGLTYLKVERPSENPMSHYTDTPIRTVRTDPLIEMYNRAQGMIKVNWAVEDTNSPGLYELEVTISRGEGLSYLKWSTLPIRVRVDEDYNLS